MIEGIRNVDGLLIGYAKVTCDVTAQKIERDTMVRNLDVALSNMSQGLCLFDSQERLVLTNSRVCEIYGVAADDIAVGTPARKFIRAILAATNGDCDADAMVAHIYERHKKILEQPGGGTLVAKLGADRVLSVVHRPLPDGSWVTTSEDISERSRSQVQVAHMALHDALTDLPNRLMFRQRLDDALHRVKRGEKCAVFCLDLDRFKTVNDTLGHPVGDALLISVAATLRDLARDTDTVARLGGDEFAIIQTDIRQSSDATALADRIVRALSQSTEIMGHLIAGSVSIGIALSPDDGVDPDQLLKSADLALYRAKGEGRGRYCYFEPGMDEMLQKRRLLELDLRKALFAKEFEVYYQPIVDIERNEVSGFEGAAAVAFASARTGLAVRFYSAGRRDWPDCRYWVVGFGNSMSGG